MPGSQKAPCNCRWSPGGQRQGVSWGRGRQTLDYAVPQGPTWFTVSLLWPCSPPRPFSRSISYLSARCKGLCCPVPLLCALGWHLHVHPSPRGAAAPAWRVQLCPPWKAGSLEGEQHLFPSLYSLLRESQVRGLCGQAGRRRGAALEEQPRQRCSRQPLLPPRGSRVPPCTGTSIKRAFIPPLPPQAAWSSPAAHETSSLFSCSPQSCFSQHHGWQCKRRTLFSVPLTPGNGTPRGVWRQIRSSPEVLGLDPFFNCKKWNE